VLDEEWVDRSPESRPTDCVRSLGVCRGRLVEVRD